MINLFLGLNFELFIKLNTYLMKIFLYYSNITIYIETFIV